MGEAVGENWLKREAKKILQNDYTPEVDASIIKSKFSLGWLQGMKTLSGL